MPVDINELTINAANDRATFKIALGDDAQEIDPTININSIVIQKEVNKIPLARITILDGDAATEAFEQSDSMLFLPGEKIQISLGFNEEVKLLFKGIIIKHSNRAGQNHSETNIECKDEAVKMTIVPKSKHYNDLTDSDVAEELIANYGLFADVENTSVVNKNLVQYNLSDWDFMVSRVDRMGKIVLVEDGTVSIKKPATDAASVLDLTYGDNILDFNAEIDSRYQINTVKVSSWDFQSQSVQTTESQFTAGQEEGNISASALSSALNTGQLDLRSASFLSEEERQSVADTRKMKDALSKIRGMVKFMGFSKIKTGDVLNIHGIGKRFNGPAFVSAIRHELADGDWTTEATLGLQPEWFAEKAEMSKANGGLGSNGANTGTGVFSMIKGLQIALVSDLEDPENEFRVRVKLPAVNENEDGIWARVATLDAGNNRGTYFAPEIGDEVIVGFINDDPTQAIILGMLHSSANPSPIAPSLQNDEKGFQTRSGIKLNFNDGDKAVKIETPGGKKITMSDQGSILKIEDENGNTVSFDAGGVTVQSTSNLNLKATGKLTLAAAQIAISGDSDLKIDATSVSINGSGATEIKGAIVKIN